MGKTIKTTRGKVRALDRAYIAGFIDGEGCLSICRTIMKHNNKYFYYIRVQCGNTDRDVVDWLKSLYEGSISTENPGKLKLYRDGNYNEPLPIHRWVLCGKNANKFLRDISPFLRQKKKQSKILLHFYNHRSHTNNVWKNKMKEKIHELNGISGKAHRPQRLSEEAP